MFLSVSIEYEFIKNKIKLKIKKGIKHTTFQINLICFFCSFTILFIYIYSLNHYIEIKDEFV